MKNILNIFLRDLKTARRDSIALIIMIMPLFLAFAIAAFTPGLSDTTVNIALLAESDAPAHIEMMKEYARVEFVATRAAAIERVNKRDAIIAMIPMGEGYEIILQGNEPESVENYARVLSALYELGSPAQGTSATLISFGHSASPVKTMLVNLLISLTIMLSGMLIALSIVQEKMDHTIRAINVTPVSHIEFVLGKTAMGGAITLALMIAMLWITGYGAINWFMILLVGVSSMALSLIIGFVQGLASSDVIEAAANVKLVMLPIAGSIAGYELLRANWQWTMYWSPFYWAYKANQLVLSQTATWPTVLLCTGMVLVLTIALYFVVKPKIRAGLQ